MKIKWIDNTSYSRGQRGETPPNILETTIDGTRIIIHRYKDYPGTWLFTCYELNIEKRDLSTDDFEEAEGRAISLLLNYLMKYDRLRETLLSYLG